MTMGDDRSDDHLKIFKCLVDTGADVLRGTFERKVLNNNAITFEQYLDSVKHPFYHQVEKNRSKPCCSRSPHVDCNVNGYMDKKIFEKVYIKTSELDTNQCLDRFKVKGGVLTDELDLSDLNFFLWNSKMLSPQEKQSLQTIMTIRSYICHPKSTQCYSITELESAWISLENDILLFAEPYRYKKMVTLQIATLKKYKVPEIESERIINEMATESEKIIREMKLEVQTRTNCTHELMKKESVGIKNCIKDTYDKTTTFINEKTQKLAENHKVLTTRCIEEIQSTVTEDGSNTRLHNEDQRRAIDSHLTESENRVCQTVIHSGGRLEDKLSEQQNEIRKQNVDLNADLMEDNRKLRAEFMDVKTEIKELKTILIGHVHKQKVELVMNTEEMQRSKESPDNRKVEMTLKVNQTHVTEDKENEIIGNLPPEVEIQTNNDISPEVEVTETLEITGKRVNSIILALKATPGILHSVEHFKAAILTLVQVMQTAGGIDADIEDTVTVNLKFESPLTEDQFAVVKCLFANESNDDDGTTQLSDEWSTISDECSSISDEYLSTADADQIESPSELDLYLQKETSKVVKPELTEVFTEPSYKNCVNKDKIIRILEEKQNETFEMFKSEILQQRERNRELMGRLKEQRERNRELMGRVEGLTSEISKLKDLSSKTVDECRNCYEKDEIIIHLDRRLCEIRRRVIEAEKESEFGNNLLKDLLQFIHQNTNMTSVQEKERMAYEELKSGISSQKSELISDFDEVRDLETKANMKVMKLQSSLGPNAGLYQTQEKSELSLRISEIRREYARNSYTKTDKQKGLGIIIQGHRRDSEIRYLEEFFAEIGYVTKCMAERDYAQFDTYLNDHDFYCIFIVRIGCEEYRYPYFIEHILHQLHSGSIGKPVILMTDSTSHVYNLSDISEEIEILIAMPSLSHRGPYLYHREKNIFTDFMKVTRLYRFADIMDILTRINGLYDCSAITFRSTLRKKFCFL